MTDAGRYTAFHEAGHAVAVLAAGGRVLSVSAEPTSRAPARVLYAGAPGRPFDAAVISLAGPLAAGRTGDPSPWLRGAGDVGAAVEALLLLDGREPGDPKDALLGLVAGDLLDQARWRAEHMLTVLWAEIERGAAALLDAPGRVLTGEQFAAAVSGADIPPADVPGAGVFVMVRAGDRRIPVPARLAELLTTEELAEWAAALAEL